MSQYPPTGEFATGSPIASSSITYMGVIPDNPTPRTDQGCPNVDYAYLSCDVDGSNCGSSVIHGSYTLRYCIGQTAGSVTGAVVTGVTGHYATPAGIVDD
ncbi:MAG: hypothetical protein PF572_06645 [Patescibacteria group bacterium]|nr:hypothetical protein [Patescibacteria group bacterium]